MKMAGLLLMAAGFALSACGEQPAKPADTVHSLMTEHVDKYADTIWGIGNAAMNDEAGIDPAKMSPEAWKNMTKTAELMEDAAKTLAALKPIRVVQKGEKIVDEGNPLAPTAARVQKQIDADPVLFAAMASSLEQHSRDLAAAARARDAAAAGRLVDEIDAVCEGCHLQFWYPEDRKIWEAIKKQ